MIRPSSSSPQLAVVPGLPRRLVAEGQRNLLECSAASIQMEEKTSPPRYLLQAAALTPFSTQCSSASAWIAQNAIEGLRSKRAIKRNFGENELSVRSGTLMPAANTG